MGMTVYGNTFSFALSATSQLVLEQIMSQSFFCEICCDLLRKTRFNASNCVFVRSFLRFVVICLEIIG
ncbi:hypothetical protein Hanom_Chr16g01497271 [Helianthus anomalus]